MSQTQPLASDNEINAFLGEHQITDLKDILYLYGSLQLLDEGHTDVEGAYFTPNACNQLLNTEQSLISVDLTARPDGSLRYDGVTIQQYEQEHRLDIGHSYYANRGPGIDHSITHKSGENTGPEKLGKYAVDRLTRWATEDAVQEVAENHPDGSIIANLPSVAESEYTGEQTVADHIKETVAERVGGKRTALLTVRVRDEHEDGAVGEYRFPGEREVFVEGTKAQLGRKLTTRNKSNSKGTGRDFISGEEGELVGTPADPLSYVSSKQQERAARLDGDESWRGYQITADNALICAKASDYIDVCDFYAFGANVFALPYFTGEITPDKARALYEALNALVTEEDTDEEGSVSRGPMARFYNALQQVPDHLDFSLDSLRFWTIVLRKEQNSLNTVFSEHGNQSSIMPIELAHAHAQVLDESGLMSGTNPAFSFPSGYVENQPLIRPSTTWQALFATITTGRYVLATSENYDLQADASIDEVHQDLMQGVLAGEPVAWERVMSTYTSRLLEEVEMSGDDILSGFPSGVIVKQFTQLLALHECGVCDVKQVRDGCDAPTLMESFKSQRDRDVHAQTSMSDQPSEPDKPTDTPERDEPSARENREAALNALLDTYPALDDAQRRSAFLLGAAIGNLTQYQLKDGKSSVLLRNHSVNALSKHNLKRTLADVVHLNSVYSQENERVGSNLMYGELMERLPETFAAKDPSEWDLSTDDLRYHYALGIAFAQQHNQ